MSLTGEVHEAGLFRAQDFKVDIQYDDGGYIVEVLHIPSGRSLTEQGLHTEPAYPHADDLKKQIEQTIHKEIQFNAESLNVHQYRITRPDGRIGGLLKVIHLPSGLSLERYSGKGAKPLSELLKDLVAVVWESGFRADTT